jgi:hypothetical protein
MAGDTTATPRTGGGFGGGAESAGGGTQQKAQEAAGAAKQQASQVAGQAQEKVGQVAGQAKEQAGQVAGQAKSVVATQVDQRSTQAGQLVTSQANDIRSISQTLREQGKDKPAQLVDQAASRIEGIGSYLTNADGSQILHDLEDFGRKRPTAILAGGLALGFLASRFLKASSSQRYQQRYSSSPQGLPTGIDRPAGVTPPGYYAGTEGGYTSGTAGGAGVSPSGIGTTGGDIGVGTLSSGVVGESPATRTGQPVDAITETERARTGTESGIPIPPSPGGQR